MKIVAEKTLEDWWATQEELDSMDDDAIIELISEDLISFLEGASFKVIRDEKK